MTAISFPTTSMPGQNPQESGGRLTNVFVESLGKTGPSPQKILRCPGMVEFGTTEDTAGSFRGALQVGSLLYSVWSGNVYTHTSVGGAGSVLTNSLTGTDPVFMARNNASTPDLVIVSPANGAFTASTTTVASYPDGDVGAPNSVCSISSYFVFSYGNGAMIASGLNSTAINTMDTATAESRPDTLYRVIPRGRTLIAAGSNSIEFWDLNSEAAGFPFSWTATHDRGIIGRYAIAGHEEGFGYGNFFVADDFSVRLLDGYSSTKISPPDLDRLIEAVEDKEDIQVSVYITQGHPMVVVQCDDWTWEYDVTLQLWHERKSYNLQRWKGMFPVKAFDVWMCGNTQDGNLYEIDLDTYTEAGEPLVCDIETAPQGQFPSGARVNRVDLFLSAAVGVASGSDPIETNPRISVSMSKDLGISYGNEYLREFGPQGLSPNVTINGLGICGPKGVKFKIQCSDPVHFALIGGDMTAVPLRN